MIRIVMLVCAGLLLSCVKDTPSETPANKESAAPTEPNRPSAIDKSNEEGAALQQVGVMNPESGDDARRRNDLENLLKQSRKVFDRQGTTYELLSLPEFRKVMNDPEPYASVVLSILGEPNRTKDERGTLAIAMGTLPIRNWTSFVRGCFSLFEKGIMSESTMMYTIWEAPFGGDIGEAIADGNRDVARLFEEMLESNHVAGHFREKLQRSIPPPDPDSVPAQDRKRAELNLLVFRCVNYFELYPNPENVLYLEDFRHVHDNPADYVDVVLSMLAESSRTKDERMALIFAMRGLRGSQLVDFARKCFLLFEKGVLEESDIADMIWPGSAFGPDFLADPKAGGRKLLEEIARSPGIGTRFRDNLLNALEK